MGASINMILGIIFSVVAIILIVATIKSGHWFKSFVTTAFSGFAALLAVNLIGIASQVLIPLNWYTIAVSGLLGAPGTILTLGVMAVFL
ncbi:MAG: pro-sigmaK processing inhibitor BofA family protein [Oscillospiraceae bacterium]